VPAYNARLAFRSTNNTTSALIVNTMHVECDVLSSPPNWDTIAADLWAWLGTGYLGILTTADKFHELTVSDENYPGSTFGQGVHTVELAGTRSPGDLHLSPGLCALTQLRTATAKRYARGHFFNPPAYGSVEATANGNWASGSNYIGACGNFAVTFGAGHTAGSTGYVPIVFSRHQVALGQSKFTFPVTSVNVSLVQRFLRSRTNSP
jgi:hypothetical protein